MKENSQLTPYYEALGVTQAQYEIMLLFSEVYWRAFVKPGFSEARRKFDANFTPEEISQRKSCILHHASIGSTPPRTNAPYVFDINGLYQRWIPKLEELANQ